jgi:GTP pyrophosphokinase
VSIGYGGITTHQIALKLTAQREQNKVATEVIVPRRPESAIEVSGVGDKLTLLAQCCHPVPGDEIIGYATRSREVTIHRQDCHDVINEDDKERLMPVDWMQTDALYPVSIHIEVWDRVGLAHDITAIVAVEKVNILTMIAADHESHATSISLTLEIRGLSQLSRLLGKIEEVRGVIAVTRVGDEATVKITP